MYSVALKTLEGMSPAVYVRHFLFGLGVAFLVHRVALPGSPWPVVVWTLLIVNTALYPFSRFAYDRIAGYITGANLFILPLVLMLGAKLFTMVLCWLLAPLVAPLCMGLLVVLQRMRPR